MVVRRQTELLLAALLVAGACTTTPRPPAPGTQTAIEAPTVGQPEPSDLLNAVAWSLRAVEHDLLVREIYRNATDRLADALADPSWNALPVDERETAAEDLPPAVILDVDETVLDSAPYDARLVLSGREHNRQDFADWCRAAAARPLPGAVEFTQEAAARGIAVFYVTNRTRDLDPWTLENLRWAGLALSGEDALLSMGTDVEGCRQVRSLKGCRRRFVGRRYRVVMLVGDQLDDFVDVAENSTGGRADAAAPYADWVGRRWWMLPNPIYGSWEAALVGNDWSRSRDARRAAKLAALEPD